MTNKFLKAKHWQVFMIAFGIPSIIQMIVMFKNPMAAMNVSIKILPILMLFYVGGYFGWLWSVAIGLQRNIPEELKLNVNRFKLFLFIPTVYLIFIVFWMTTTNLAKPDIEQIKIILPLHLFSIFCILYCFYFAAKTFKTAELQRKITYIDYTGEFWMIWFFPIGIWMIQPKINKLVER